LFSIAVFAALNAFILYTVAGYPIILGWMARRRARPVEKKFAARTVSFVIAVYNGANFLAGKLRSVLALDYPRELMEIVVVSDASTDATDDIARSFSGEGVKLIRVPRGGKPAALNAAVPGTSGEILVLTDVRQTLEPESLRRMIACFGDPAVGVVSGDMVVRSGNIEETNVGLYWRYERWIRKQLGRVDSMMGATGPFYAIRRELFRPMPKDLLLDDMFVPLNAFFEGYRLIVEEDARAFDYPTGVETEFWRKVRTLAGNYQLLRYLPELLSFRNRMLFHYVSYKVARLLLPWAVLAVVVVSFGLPRPWREAALVGQGLFYALALTDVVAGPGTLWKRVSSPARTVVSMLAATACAVAIFFVPAQKLWKPTQIPVGRKGNH
jgi:cellulose synthase/poly-beta-1,6-N-acetylglucosamine synthase-like glycosyltransferase